MSKLWVIAGQEFAAHVRRRTFLREPQGSQQKCPPAHVGRRTFLLTTLGFPLLMVLLFGLIIVLTVNAQNVGPQLTTQSAGGYASFTASGLPSTIYTVQISTNLADAPPFNDYLSVTSAPNGVINYTDTVSIDGHGGQAYYRLKQYVAP